MGILYVLFISRFATSCQPDDNVKLEFFSDVVMTVFGESPY